MPAFSLQPLIPSIRSRITALYQHDDRVYVGLATGQLCVYSCNMNILEKGVDSDEAKEEETSPEAKLVQTYPLARRQIDQIGILTEAKLLVILSDSVISLYNLSDFSKSPTTFPQARTVHSFCTTTYTPKRSRSGSADDESKDLIVIGCRKKVVVYGAGKGGLEEAWELAIPHSPRQILIPTSSGSYLPETVHLLFTPTSSSILHLNPSSPSNHLSISDLSADPAPPSISGPSQDDGGTGSGFTVGKGAFSGLGGYVGLGGRAVGPMGTVTVGGEVLLSRDEAGVFYSNEGNYTRQRSLNWGAPPGGLGYSNPYIYALIPASLQAPNSAPSLQIHLAPTLALRQSLPLPPPSAGILTSSSLTLISTSSTPTPAETTKPSVKLLFVTTPSDKTLAASEGSSVWALQSGDLGMEIDGLVREGKIDDAIGLVEAVGELSLPPNRRLPHLKTLRAVHQMARGEFQAAMDTFLVFNVNPALVLSLYPEATISGKLHVPKSGWLALFGAVEGAKLNSKDADGDEGESVKGLLDSMKNLGKTGRDGDTGSVRSVESKKGVESPGIDGEEEVASKAALEALMYFLSDRRQKLSGAISSNPLPLENSLPPLHSLSASDQQSLPSVPFTDLSPGQLLRMAQVIYTGLIKVYLVARPVLVGSLCRIENWCDVAEVEGLLKEKKKFGDLIDLYQGKKMHKEALGMLHELAQEEDDPLDRYPPTISYLHKLGPEYLDLIFAFSEWILDEDPSRALSIFTADEPEVDALPRQKVTSFLEKNYSEACKSYLEHVIHTLEEEGGDYHDLLAGFYLEGSRAKKAGSDMRHESYEKLLDFLKTSQHYRPYRLLNKLSTDEAPQARAILLGRLGKHEEALNIYVYKLQDYDAAEEYCVRTYATKPDIFLLLLQLYLKPTTSSTSAPNLLPPALSLTSKYSTSLPPSPVLSLLPPLVPLADVASFFLPTLRKSYRHKIEGHIVRQVALGRKEEVEGRLMGLEVKKVRVTVQRVCPGCQKRLGMSAIAVHAPRGEVTHLHCKDKFSAKLATLRD